MSTIEPAPIIGFILFGISELLPLLNIPTNGIIHTFIIGFKKAFKYPENANDIELATTLLNNKPEYANIIQNISSNTFIQKIIKNLLDNPTNINNIAAIQDNADIAKIVSVARNNPKIKDMLNNVLDDPNIYNNINTLLTHPEFNTLLLNAIKIPTITTNIEQLLNNPQLSNIINILANDINKLNSIQNTLDNL